MPSLTPFRIREHLRSFFWPNLEDLQRMAEEDLRVMEAEFQPLDIPEAEVSPPIPDELSLRQFPQKEFVAGVTDILPTIFSTPTPNGELLFVALTFAESIEKTEAKFYFPPEMQEEASVVILQWAQAYQDKNYMLSALMATVHWGIVPQ